MTNKNFLINCTIFLLHLLVTISSQQERKLELNNELSSDAFFNVLNKWNTSILETNELEVPDTEDEDDDIFKNSAKDSTMIFTDVTKCMAKYSLYDCTRMLMLTRIKILVSDLESSNKTGVDLKMLKGFVNFKWHNLTEEEEVQIEQKSNPDLGQQLNSYILRLFKSRSLQVSLLPGFGIEFAPKSRLDNNGFVCFTAKTFQEPEFNNEVGVAETRKKADKDKNKKKKKKGGFNMMPMMIVPQMIMLGMLPFALANLKAMVMNAFMMNTMALNSMIFMTVRNLVFGPRKGPKIKYVNYGYNKKKVNKKPELVLHSPAAFVKKPHHDNSHHSPSTDHYDDPNSYNYNYRRRNENKEKNRLRQKTKDNKDSYNNYQNNDSYDEADVDAPVSYLNNNQFLGPSSNNNNQFIGSHSNNYEFQGSNNQFQGSNNQFQGSNGQYDNTGSTGSQSGYGGSFYDSNNGYQLPSAVDDSNNNNYYDKTPTNTFSSKYNEDHNNQGDRYSNHRVHR